MDTSEDSGSQTGADDFDILDVVAARISLAGGGSSPLVDADAKTPASKTSDEIVGPERSGSRKAKFTRQGQSTQLASELSSDLESRMLHPDDNLTKTTPSEDTEVTIHDVTTGALYQPQGSTPTNNHAQRKTSPLIPGAFAYSVSSPDDTRSETISAAGTANTVGFDSGSALPSTNSLAVAIGEDLAQAVPVQLSRPVLPQADAVDLEAQAAKHDRSNRNQRLLLLAGGLILLTIVLVGVSLGVYQEQHKPSSVSLATPTPTFHPPPPLAILSSEEHVLSLLPKETAEAISADPISPQSLAFDFCKNDPNLYAYPDWRIQQRFALATLFYSASGATTWKRNNGWMSYSIHECQWYSFMLHQNIDPEKEGLSPFYGNEYNNPCNNTDPSVVDKEVYVKLWIWFHGLEGTIPPQVSLLTSLISFSLGYNPNITGTIPSQLGVLSELEILDLAETSVSGTIPLELGHLSSLKSLHLMDTFLSGRVPDELSLLTLNITGTDLVVP